MMLSRLSFFTLVLWVAFGLCLSGCGSSGGSGGEETETTTDPTAEAELVNTAGCDVDRAITDGGQGYLHKPVSDSTGSVVNLLPAGEVAATCRYEFEDGSLFSEAYNSGFHNGNRQHWRPTGGGHCSVFPYPTLFACQIGGLKYCWLHPDPCTRYD